MALTSLTHPATRAASDPPSRRPITQGLYRDPLPLSDGTLVAVHTPEYRTATPTPAQAPARPRATTSEIKVLTTAGNGYRVGGQPLTSGIVKTISYWDPYEKVTYTGPMWELQPVEVRARPRPARRTAHSTRARAGRVCARRRRPGAVQGRPGQAQPRGARHP